MTNYYRDIAQNAGRPPGSLIHIGDTRVDTVSLSLVNYDNDVFTEFDTLSVEDCLPYRDEPGICWISLHGLQDVSIVEQLGNCFGLHPLVMEDILNTHQRPKMEDYGDLIFVVLKTVVAQGEESHLEQVSLVLGRNFVLTFMESDPAITDPLRERIRAPRSRIRRQQADYLAYAIMDMIVDNYFVVLEQLGERIELLEERLVLDPSTKLLKQIHQFKNEMLFLRKSVWPMREVAGSLSRGDTPLIQDSTLPYIRDVHDHAIQIIDTLETYRDMISGMLDIYLSSISYRMNEVMKVLTIISTIFMPLTFLTGVYGMNFAEMPGRDWQWGFSALLALMLAISLCMIRYFKIKRWL